MNFWGLPGPARFLSAAREALAYGKNLVLWLPSRVPPGLETEVRACVDGFPHELPPPDRPSLLAHLACVLLSGVPPADLSEAVDQITRDPGCMGRTFWVDVSPRDWPDWLELLRLLSRRSQNLRFSERAQFIVALRGVGSISTVGEPDLEILRWEGFVTETDLLFYSCHSGATGVEAELRASVASEVAGYDPEVVDRILTEPVGVLVDPAPLLRRMAAEWGWLDHAEPSWLEGTADGSRRHPAFLALKNPSELTRRVWRAHLKVLFPRIEESRLRFVRSNRSLVRLPYDSEYGLIEDELDLEWRHLEEMVMGGHPSLWQEARLFRTARNRLAHLEPLDSETLARLLSLV